jgi:transcriptional regulator with XRE-family HTH domain
LAISGLWRAARRRKTRPGFYDNEDRGLNSQGERNMAQLLSKTRLSGAAGVRKPTKKRARPAETRHNALAKGPNTASFDDLGSQIRDLRRAKGLNLSDLSRLTGKSIGYLSQVERNLSEPTLRGLQDLSNALGVQIGYFFHETEPVPADEQGLIVRKNRRKRLNYHNGVVDHLLSPNLSGQLELLLAEFEPGYSSGDSITHKGEEAGLVLSGALDIWIGDKRFSLQEGDSFTFNSSTPHRFENNRTDKTVVVWAITPPTY